MAEQIDDGASGSDGSGDDQEERISIRAPVSVDYDYEDEDEFAEEPESRGSGSRGPLNPPRGRSGRGERAAARRSPLGSGGGRDDDEEEERMSIRAPLSVDDWNGDEDEEGEEERVSIRAPISMDDDGDDGDDDDDDRSTANTETTGAGSKKPPSIHAPLSVEGDDEEDDDTWLKRLRARTKGSGTRSTTGGGSSAGRRRTRRSSGEFDRRSRLSAEVYGGKKVGRSKRKNSIGGDFPGFGFGPGGVLGVGDLTVPRARITSDAEDFSAPPAVSGDAEDGESEEESGISSADPRSPLLGSRRGKLEVNARAYAEASVSAETSGADGRAQAGEGQPVAEAEVWQLVADVMTRKEQEKVRGREARGDKGSGDGGGAESDKLAAALSDGAGKSGETPAKEPVEGSVVGAEILKECIVDDASVQTAGEAIASRVATAGSAPTAAAAGGGGAGGGVSSGGAVPMTLWTNENGSEANSRSLVTNSTGATEGGSECSTAEEIAHLHADLGWTGDEAATRGEREQETREGREAVRGGGEVADAVEGDEESGDGELAPPPPVKLTPRLATAAAAAGARDASPVGGSTPNSARAEAWRGAWSRPLALAVAPVRGAANDASAAKAAGAAGGGVRGSGASGRSVVARGRREGVLWLSRHRRIRSGEGVGGAGGGGGNRDGGEGGGKGRSVTAAGVGVTRSDESGAVCLGGSSGGEEEDEVESSKGWRETGGRGKEKAERGGRGGESVQKGSLAAERPDSAAAAVTVRADAEAVAAAGAAVAAARVQAEALQRLRVLLLRVAMRLQQPRTHPLVAQTLYRLELAERMSARGRAGAEAGAGGRGTAGGAAGAGGGAGGDGMVGRRVREMVMGDAQVRAGELEEESLGCGQLGLHVSVLVLGRRAVGKSATVRSLLDLRAPAASHPGHDRDHVTGSAITGASGIDRAHAGVVAGGVGVGKRDEGGEGGKGGESRAHGKAEEAREQGGDGARGVAQRGGGETSEGQHQSLLQRALGSLGLQMGWDGQGGIQEVVGEVCGVGVRVLELPGLGTAGADMAGNERVLLQLRRFLAEESVVLVLTHAAAATPTAAEARQMVLAKRREQRQRQGRAPGEGGGRREGKRQGEGEGEGEGEVEQQQVWRAQQAALGEVVARRAQYLQQCIRVAAGDQRLCNPVVVAENGVPCWGVGQGSGSAAPAPTAAGGGSTKRAWGGSAGDEDDAGQLGCAGRGKGKGKEGATQGGVRGGRGGGGAGGGGRGGGGRGGGEASGFWAGGSFHHLSSHEQQLLSAAQMRRYRAELAAWEGRAERLLCKEQRRVRRQQARLRQVNRAGGGGAAAVPGPAAGTGVAGAERPRGGNEQQQQGQGQGQEQEKIIFVPLQYPYALLLDLPFPLSPLSLLPLFPISLLSSSPFLSLPVFPLSLHLFPLLPFSCSPFSPSPPTPSSFPFPSLSPPAPSCSAPPTLPQVSAVFPLSLPPPWPVWEHAPPFNALLLDRCLAASSHLPAAVTAQLVSSKALLLLDADLSASLRHAPRSLANPVTTAGLEICLRRTPAWALMMAAGGAGEGGGGGGGGRGEVWGASGMGSRIVSRGGNSRLQGFGAISGFDDFAQAKGAAAAADRAGAGVRAARTTAAAEPGSDGAGAARGRGAGESGTRGSGGAASSLHATSGARGAGGAAASLELASAAAAATCTVRSDVRVSLFRGNRTAAGVAVAMGSDYGDGVAVGAKLSSRVALGRCVRVSGSAAAVRWGQEEAVGATCRLQVHAPATSSSSSSSSSSSASSPSMSSRAMAAAGLSLLHWQGATIFGAVLEVQLPLVAPPASALFQKGDRTVSGRSSKGKRSAGASGKNSIGHGSKARGDSSNRSGGRGSGNMNSGSRSSSSSSSSSSSNTGSGGSVPSLRVRASMDSRAVGGISVRMSAGGNYHLHLLTALAALPPLVRFWLCRPCDERGELEEGSEEVTEEEEELGEDASFPRGTSRQPNPPQISSLGTTPPNHSPNGQLRFVAAAVDCVVTRPFRRKFISPSPKLPCESVPQLLQIAPSIRHTEPHVREQVEMVLTANDDVWLEGEVMQWEQQERSGMQKLRERRLAKIAAKAAAAGVIRTSAIRPPWAGGTLGRKIPSAAPWSPFSRNVSAAAARAARPSQPAPEPAIDDEPDFQDEWADVRASFDHTLADYRKTLKTRSPKIGETPNPLKHFLPRLAADVDAAATDAQNLAVAPVAVAGGATGLWDRPSHPGAAGCEDCREAEQRATVAYLLNQRGYDACRRVTEWAYSRGIPSGEYEFVEVAFPTAIGASSSPQPTKPHHLSQQQYQQQQTPSSGKAYPQDKPPVQQDRKQQVVIVDITFRAQFTLFRPTPEYQALWSAIPRVFVGTPATLRKLLALLIEAMRVCMASQSLHLPPWRRSQYMNSKWLAPSRRRGAAAPPAAASPSPSPSHTPPALCPMHQREAEAGDAWCGACSGSKSGAEAVTGGGESGSGRPRRLRAAGATGGDGGSSSCGSVSSYGASSVSSSDVSTFGCSCRSCSSEQASMMLKANAVARLAANLLPTSKAVLTPATLPETLASAPPATAKPTASDCSSKEASLSKTAGEATTTVGKSGIAVGNPAVAVPPTSPRFIPVDAALLSDLATAITRRLPSSTGIRKQQQQQDQQQSASVAAARQQQGFDIGRGAGKRSSSNSSSAVVGVAPDNALHNITPSSNHDESDEAPFWELLLPAGSTITAAAGHAEVNAASFMRQPRNVGARHNSPSAVSAANYRSPNSSGSAFQGGATTSDACGTMSAVTTAPISIANRSSRVRKAGLLSLQLRASSVPDIRNGSMLQVGARVASRPS
ncbi:unnamed protein product [Closterium sp. NIES-65]|nr:unnamed protein product [Closterium sp. NIES-65]